MIDLILPKFESIRDFYGDGPRPRSPERTSRKPTGCLIYVIWTKRGARSVERGRESTRPVKTYFPIGNNDDFRWNVEMNTDETSSNNTRRPLYASWTQLPERKKEKNVEENDERNMFLIGVLYIKGRAPWYPIPIYIGCTLLRRPKNHFATISSDRRHFYIQKTHKRKSRDEPREFARKTSFGIMMLSVLVCQIRPGEGPIHRAWKKGFTEWNKSM